MSINKILSKKGRALETLKAFAKVALLADEALREIGVKIVDDDQSDGSVELESITDGSMAWVEL
jgi:hypothetical protein